MPVTTKKAFLFLIILFLLGIGVIKFYERNYNASVSPEVSGDKLCSLKKLSPRYGGTLFWGTSNAPVGMNPVLTSYSESTSLMMLIFNRLVRINVKGEIEPDLAESWDISDDNRIYTFYLRKNVVFHDGEPCTAEDVKFTYEQIMNLINESPYRSDFRLVDHLEIPDAYTFKIFFKEPFKAFLFKSARREIIPKHILENQDLKNAAFNYHPIGTGPFRFSSWDQTTHQIVLDANPDYFEGRPYLDHIIVKSYPGIEELWLALMKGEVDLVKFIDRDSYQVLQKDSTFKTYTINWKMYCAILYNLKDPILKSLDMRRAIAHSINRPKLMKETFGGGVESLGPFHPESAEFSKKVTPLGYDPLKAKRIFKMMGWQDSDRDGILDKQGKPLEIRMLIVEDNDIFMKVAKMIRQQLAEVGIKLIVIPYRTNEDLSPEFLQKHHAQAWLRFFAGGGGDPYQVIKSWSSSSTFFGNLWHYQNPEVDRLIERARGLKDNKDAEEIYRRIHEIIYVQQPACFLFFPSSFHAVRSKFHPTEDFFSNTMPVFTVKDWFLENPD